MLAYKTNCTIVAGKKKADAMPFFGRPMHHYYSASPCWDCDALLIRTNWVRSIQSHQKGF